MLIVCVILILMLFVGIICLDIKLTNLDKQNNATNENILNHVNKQYSTFLTNSLDQTKQVLSTRLDKLENLIGEYYYNDKWVKLYKDDIIETHGDSTKIKSYSEHLEYWTYLSGSPSKNIHVENWVPNKHIIKYADLLQPLKDAVVNNIPNDTNHSTIKDLAKKHNITVEQVLDIFYAFNT